MVGRNRYGVFPLRGKVANPRDANHEQIMKNEEIKNLKTIRECILNCCRMALRTLSFNLLGCLTTTSLTLSVRAAVGLQQCNKYDNGPVGLRYGHVMIMADRRFFNLLSACVCTGTYPILKESCYILLSRRLSFPSWMDVVHRFYVIEQYPT